MSASELSERERAFLKALAESDRPLHAGRVAHLALPDEPYRARRDAGATRTLDSLQRRGLVRGGYAYTNATSRTITENGREVLA
jgi:repressor of nif and glnA expression